MAIEATATSTRLPDQPIQITVQVQEKDKKDDGYLPGQKIYWAIEGLMHVGMAYRPTMDCGLACKPVYLNVYLMAAAAGTVFGLYRAMNGKPCNDIQGRAKAFAEGEWKTKALAVAEQAGIMAGPLLFAEGIELDKNLTAGNLVAAYWGFGAGAELASITYKYFTSAEE